MAHIPNGCAAVIEVAQGMMVFGDRAVGCAMMRDLLRQAERNNCAKRPECAQALHIIGQIVAEAEAEATETAVLPS